MSALLDNKTISLLGEIQSHARVRLSFAPESVIHQKLTSRIDALIRKLRVVENGKPQALHRQGLWEERKRHIVG
jgi:hypothetical protein